MQTHITNRLARPEAAFTMVEIALAVAVIGFALVAVLGILPLGMEVQRDNRNETIVNQDGTLILDAIRSGPVGVEDLEDYVDRISTNGVNILPLGTSSNILRHLSTVNSTNIMILRSISGAASDKSPSPNSKDLAARYQVVCQIRRAQELGTVSHPNAAVLSSMATNLYEVRLAFYWPAVRSGPDYVVPDTARRQVFRTVLSGQVDSNGFFNTGVFYR